MTDVTPDQVERSRVACAYCGYDLSGTAIGGKCPECGASVAESVRVSSAAGTPAGGTDSSPVVCLVFGVIALVTGCTPLGFVAIWQHGVAKRAIAQGRAPKDQMVLATVGLIMGWIAVAFFLLGLLFFAIIFLTPILLAIFAAAVSSVNP
ncbi:MAG: hypothetical protein AAF586_04700 [Planctomycetota bacterium]